MRTGMHTTRPVSYTHLDVYKRQVLQQMDILSCFDNEIAVPNITSLDEFNNVMIESGFLDDSGRVQVLNKLAQVAPRLNIGIKRALTNIETARHDDDSVNEIIDLMAQAVV